MNAVEIFLFVPLLSFVNLEQTTAQQDVCPPWFIPDNKSSTGCSCRTSYDEVVCGSHSALLKLGFCMTYNYTTETAEYGPCPYITHYKTVSAGYVLYVQLPQNVSLLNEFMCGPLNREGELCGKCKDGYGIALYSYTLECSKCWGHSYGWVLYYFLELFPITVMYFLVVIFHIRATSSPLSALVFMSQIVVYTVRLNATLHMYIENEVTGFPHVLLKVLLVLCGIWSLDFFRSVIPTFCVSSNIKTIHVLALEYLVAFYPIFLIIITYVCIKLHDNNFRPVVWLWKPFHQHFVHFRRRWDSKASIVNAFTTFLLLSFSKILFVCITLLHFGHIRIRYITMIGIKCALYYDPTVECHTLEYAIFTALALCVLVVFICCPIILLILYPTRLFRKCVSCCGFRRWHALHMFVESFQGQYKDGTNGTRDFRMFSASFLILRLLILVAILTWHHNAWVSLLLGCLIFVVASYFYATMRPYKSNLSNNVDIWMLGLLTVLSLAFVIALTIYPWTQTSKYCVVAIILLIGVPHMVLIFYICYVLAKKVGITECLKRRYKSLKGCVLSIRCTNPAEPDVEADPDIDSLPDRLINPGAYEPLLQNLEAIAANTENKQTVNEDLQRLTLVHTYGTITNAANT